MKRVFLTFVVATLVYSIGVHADQDVLDLETVARLVQSHKVRSLRVALAYGDSTARRNAVRVLAGLGAAAEPAVPALAEALKDKDREVRAAVIEVLGKIGPAAKGAVPALVEILKDRDDPLQPKALDALARIGPGAAAAVPVLIDCLKDTGTATYMTAINALGKVGTAARKAVPLIVRALKSKNRNVRESAAYALGNIGDPVETVLPALVRALGDTDAVVRERGARGLGMLGPKAAKAEPALRKALADKDKTVAARAAWALGQLGAKGEQTIAGLIEALHSTQMRPLAAAALGRAGKPGIDALVKMLKAPDAPRRVLAAQALARIGPPAKAAAPALKEAAKDKDAAVRNAAVLALKKVLLPPEKVVNALHLTGTRAIKCTSSWHNINRACKVAGTVNLSGAEALKLLPTGTSAKPAQVPDKLVRKIGERLFRGARFTPADAQSLARWLGSGKRDEKINVTGKLFTSRNARTPAEVMQASVALEGVIWVAETHRLASRYGPNSHNTRWTMSLAGKLTVDTATGHIEKAAITVQCKVTGSYGSERYTEKAKLTLRAAAAPK